MSSAAPSSLPSISRTELRAIMSVLADATGTFVTGYDVVSPTELRPVMTVLPSGRDDKPASS